MDSTPHAPPDMLKQPHPVPVADGDPCRGHALAGAGDVTMPSSVRIVAVISEPPRKAPRSFAASIWQLSYKEVTILRDFFSTIGARLGQGEPRGSVRSASASNLLFGGGHIPFICTKLFSGSPSSTYHSTEGSPSVGQGESPHSQSSGSPPPPPPPPLPRAAVAADEGEAEGYSAFQLGVHAALFGYSAGVAGAMLAELKNFTAGWGDAEKVAFQIAAVASAVSTGTGLITAGYGYYQSSRRGKLSDICAKFGTITSTGLLTVGLSCSVGGHVGCVAGVPSAGVVASIMTSICAKDAISRLWGRLWSRKDQPAAASAQQSVQLGHPRPPI